MISFVCDAPGCRRGIVRVGEWGRQCHYCVGLGTLSVKRMASILQVNEDTLRAFLRPDHNPRQATCQRILDAAIGILEPHVEGRQLTLHSCNPNDGS